MGCCVVVWDGGMDDVFCEGGRRFCAGGVVECVRIIGAEVFVIVGVWVVCDRETWSVVPLF